jgi:hypothetical protein
MSVGIFNIILGLSLGFVSVAFGVRLAVESIARWRLMQLGLEFVDIDEIEEAEEEDYYD